MKVLGFLFLLGCDLEKRPGPSLAFLRSLPALFFNGPALNLIRRTLTYTFASAGNLVDVARVMRSTTGLWPRIAITGGLRIAATGPRFAVTVGPGQRIGTGVGRGVWLIDTRKGACRLAGTGGQRIVAGALRWAVNAGLQLGGGSARLFVG